MYVMVYTHTDIKQVEVRKSQQNQTCRYQTQNTNTQENENTRQECEIIKMSKQANENQTEFI